MPVIVFDSYDATGKTNYAQALSNELGYPLPPSFTSQLPEFDDVNQHRFWSKAQYFMLARILASGSRIDLIMDRWVFTEYCYSPVLRKYNIGDYYWSIDKAVSNRNLLWVYTSIDAPNFTDILKFRFEKNGEKYVTIPQTLQIRKNYEELYKKSSVPRIRIDTSKDDQATISENIKKILAAIIDLTCPLEVTYKRYVEGPLSVTGMTGE